MLGRCPLRIGKRCVRTLLSRHRGAFTLIAFSMSQLQLFFNRACIGAEVVLVIPHIATLLLLDASVIAVKVIAVRFVT